MKSYRLAAAFTAYPGPGSETNARILVESIRAFGGKLAGITLWCLTPAIKNVFSKPFLELLDTRNVEIVRFRTDRAALRFPLAADVAAAAWAEKKARRGFDLLAWLGANTIVLREPRHFVIPMNKKVGFRPVHHINIGSPVDRPLDAFWTLVYGSCNVPPGRVFSMRTHVDAKTIRPYFNASSMVIRPGCGLFRAWRGVFFKSFQKKDFKAFYQKDKKYAVFMHQAILSGIILAQCKRRDVVQLPSAYNYPLHLWNQDITGGRPRRLSELITARHEGFYRDPDWRRKMPSGGAIMDWLEKRLKGAT